MDATTITSGTIFTLSSSKIIINSIMAIMGDIVRVLSKKDKQGNIIKPTIWNFAGGVVCAIFVGFIVYFVCESYQVSNELTAAATGAAGYVGPQLLDVFFDKLQKWADKKINNI